MTKLGSIDGPRSRKRVSRVGVGIGDGILEEMARAERHRASPKGNSTAESKPPTKLHRDAWEFAHNLGASQVSYGRFAIAVRWPEEQDPPVSRKAAIRRGLRTGLRWNEDAKRWLMADAVEQRLRQRGFQWDESNRSWVKALRRAAPRRRV